MPVSTDGAAHVLDAPELTAAHRREADLVFGEPVFTPQAIYATELRKIAGDHREAAASSVAGDQQIVTADGQSPARQARLDLSGVKSNGRGHERCGSAHSLATPTSFA
jgi:hypothetical protein